ncbi:hypothetical protein GGTG_09239 [Gaeumannomyces tritici R3-111a-1]|uniref:Uncharacterized protein n=1 Tax=Gaeumannomyces tritici (strain R3-111a-1) TaxID=644352 RepID=J3P6U7_GAET3|nr:hypothetical protein GGTG_09239 [Gaeumannomyces tritici R3-111a-1]EJT72373.1 hypothetical protein GGTG_09239 [Gaeumannomyces tritici R3-111a-1]
MGAMRSNQAPYHTTHAAIEVFNWLARILAAQYDLERTGWDRETSTPVNVIQWQNAMATLDLFCLVMISLGYGLPTVPRQDWRAVSHENYVAIQNHNEWHDREAFPELAFTAVMEGLLSRIRAKTVLAPGGKKKKENHRTSAPDASRDSDRTSADTL